MLYSFWLACTAGGIEQEEWMLTIDNLRFTLDRFIFDQFIKGVITTGLPMNLFSIALDNTDCFDTFTSLFECFIHNRLKQIGFAFSESTVCRHNQLCLSIDNTITQCFR